MVPFKPREQAGQRLELGRLDLPQLGQRLGPVAVVGQRVRLVLDAGDVGMQAEGFDEDRHQAGRVGLQGQPDQVVHQLAGDRQLRSPRRPAGSGTLTTRLGPLLPLLGLVQPALQVADAGEILVEPIAVLGAKVLLEPSWRCR